MKLSANTKSSAQSQEVMATDDKDSFRLGDDYHHSSSYNSNGSVADDSSSDESPAKTSRVDISTSIRTAPSKRKQARNVRATGSMIHRQLITLHEYHDHALDPIVDLEVTSSPRGKGNKSPSNVVNFTTPFPTKLCEMIDEIEAQGLSNVASWQPHGRCLKVHDIPTFKILLENYFKLSKLASFQRQLNLYGFKRLTVGLDKGSYYHELFLRSRPDLVRRINRVKVKGTGVRAKSNPDDEPNLYSYPAVDARAEMAPSASTTYHPNLKDQVRATRIQSTECNVVAVPIYANLGNTFNKTPSYTEEVQSYINDDVKATS